MQINLWRGFSKRKNSTKRPSTPDAVIDVKLKEDTSIEKPSFILSGQQFEYNYVQAIGHYYYVNDIISLANGLTQINCEQDLLATYKSEIQSTTAFVEYASGSYNRGMNDTRISSIGTSSIFNRSGEAALFDSTGFYVLSVVSTQSGAKDGFAVYYILTATQVTNLANQFAGTSENILESIAKITGSAYDSIISCKWLPFSYSTIVGNRCGSAGDVVVIGNYGAPVVGNAYYVTNAAPLTSGTTFASIWGSSSGVEPFKRVEPYTHITAYLPYYGNVSIPTLPIANYDKLQFDYSVDFITGDVTTRISISGGDEPLMTINYNVAVDAPVAQVTDHSGSIATVIAGVGATALSGGSLAPTAGAISGALQSLSVGTSVKGSISGRSYKGYGNSIRIVVETVNTTDVDKLTAVQGRMLHNVVPLSTLSGYVKTINASVNMAGLSNDKAAINSALDSGIYIE